jgi:hypothetical protein
MEKERSTALIKQQHTNSDRQSLEIEGKKEFQENSNSSPKFEDSVFGVFAG